MPAHEERSETETGEAEERHESGVSRPVDDGWAEDDGSSGDGRLGDDALAREFATAISADGPGRCVTRPWIAVFAWTVRCQARDVDEARKVRVGFR